MFSFAFGSNFVRFLTIVDNTVFHFQDSDLFRSILEVNMCLAAWEGGKSIFASSEFKKHGGREGALKIILGFGIEQIIVFFFCLFVCLFVCLYE